MNFANDILDAIEIMVKQVVEDNATKIYTGVCKTIGVNDCVLTINGKDNTVKYYGGVPVVGTVYQVFIPFGNMSAAFIIVPGSGGGSGGSGVDSVNGMTGEVVLSASDVGAYSKKETNTLLQNKADKDRVVNPNLLDNWYFGNPINQRGFITTSIEEYTIDRWYTARYRTGTKSVTLNDGHVTISCDDSADGAYMELAQNIESDISTYLVGKQITLSVLTKTGLYSSTFVPVDGSYHTFDINNECTVYFQARIKSTADIRIRCYNGNSVNLIAVKLELGSQQTLAHQESGVWVLNEIPDYGEQLARCQRYFVNFNPNKVKWFAMPSAVASNTTDAYSAVTLPVAMRAQPTVSYGGKIALSQTGDVQVTGIQVSGNTFAGNYLQLKYSVADGLTANSTYRVQGYNDSTSYIWLSADL